MKKVIGIGFLLVVVSGIVYLSVAGLPQFGISFLDGEKTTAKRGDMTIPVTATGKVEAARILEIKSKASGRLMAINVVEGQMVQEGMLMAKLDPVDERRNVEAREAALHRAQSALEKAKIALEDRELELPLSTREARLRLEDSEARLKEAEFRYNKVKGFSEDGNAGDIELVSAQAAFQVAKATRDLAKVQVERAEKNERLLLKSSREDVVSAQGTVDEAQKALDEAKERLSDTEIIAPADAMVYSIIRKEGELIQSGTTSMTGGSPILYLADTSSMFVMAQVDEADIGSIREIAPEHATPGKTQRLSDEEYRRLGNEIISQAAERAEEKQSDSDADESDEKNADVNVKARPAAASGGAKVVLASMNDGSSSPATDDEELSEDDVPESVKQDLLGRPVEVKVEAYRNEDFKGVIERILPEPVQTAGSVAFRVRIRLFGEEVEKLMGMQADLSFETKTQNDVILVPNEALHSEGTECFVYIPHRESDDQRWDKKKVPVEIGETDGVDTVIHTGIKAGDEVWTKLPQFTDRERRERGD